MFKVNSKNKYISNFKYTLPHRNLNYSFANYGIFGMDIFYEFVLLSTIEVSSLGGPARCMSLEGEFTEIVT